MDLGGATSNKKEHHTWPGSRTDRLDTYVSAGYISAVSEQAATRPRRHPRLSCILSCSIRFSHPERLIHTLTCVSRAHRSWQCYRSLGRLSCSVPRVPRRPLLEPLQAAYTLLSPAVIILSSACITPPRGSYLALTDFASTSTVLVNRSCVHRLASMKILTRPSGQSVLLLQAGAR